MSGIECDPGGLIQAARDLGPTIIGLRDRIERQRRLPDELIEQLRDLGFFSLWRAHAYGGPELSLTEFIQVIEVLAELDASVAWCVTNAGAYARFSGYLPEEVARQIFVQERAVLAGNLGPFGRAVSCDGGYRVSGHWAYGSGITASTWTVGGCVVLDGDTPRRAADGTPDTKVMFFPTSSVEVIDTWDVGGLRGTGSHDYRVADLFVPGSHIASWDTPLLDGALFRAPKQTVLPITIAAVPLGIARAALNAVLELAQAKTPRLGTALLRDKPTMQAAVARAEAALASARAFLLQATEEVWTTVVRNDPATLKQRATVRLACAQVAEAAKFVVQTAYDLGGGTAIYERSPIQRCFRDAHAAAQHIQVQSGNFETVGRVLLGLDPGTPVL